jgi:hypothetical protein
MRNILKIISFIPIIAVFNVIAVDKNPCAVPESSISTSMVDSMVNDFGIVRGSIAENKIKMELIDNTAVNKAYASYLANEDYKKDTEHFVKLDEYKKIYLEDNPRNLITKISIENNKGLQNTFISSSIVNDNECSVRFNGYITVKREY